MKIVGISLINTFVGREPKYKRILEESRFILEQSLQKEGVKYHSILGRIKSFESFESKLKRKTRQRTKPTPDPFAEVTDIAGVRVVCLFLSDIARVGRVIRQHFDVISEDDKIEGAKASSFGYMSVHFVVNLKKSYSGPRYDDLADVPLEIQVRTIAMDAWATISHYLSYKSDTDVPRELRRDFYALSGLFYVADSHFEMFFRERERSRREMTAELRSGQPGLDQEINFDSLTAYFGLRFPDRERNAPEEISELVQELRDSGYRRLKMLNDAIERGYDAFLAYEKDLPPTDPDNPDARNNRFAQVGVARILLAIVDKTYRDQNYQRASEFQRYEGQIKQGP